LNEAEVSPLLLEKSVPLIFETNSLLVWIGSGVFEDWWRNWTC
jgi:hypothetical protein